MQKSDPSWMCRECAVLANAPAQLPWPGAVCACGAQPSYLDVLAALKHDAERQSRDAVELQKGTREGQWWPCRAESGGRSAMLRCPACGRPAFLHDYEIDAAGVVQPQFACGGAECDYERTIKLVGWASLTRGSGGAASG